jgi:hypothetical protein
MDAHAVIGSRMVPMSRFTGRLSFTIWHHLCDAQRADNRVGTGLDATAKGTGHQLTKTREIIGTYDNNYNLVANNRRKSKTTAKSIDLPLSGYPNIYANKGL